MTNKEPDKFEMAVLAALAVIGSQPPLNKDEAKAFENYFIQYEKSLSENDKEILKTLCADEKRIEEIATFLSNIVLLKKMKEIV